MNLGFACLVGCAPVDAEVAQPGDEMGDAAAASSDSSDPDGNDIQAYAANQSAMTAEGAAMRPADRGQMALPGVSAREDASVSRNVADNGSASTSSGAAKRGGDLPGVVEDLGWNDEQVARVEKAQPVVLKYCAQRRLDPNLINAIIWVESKFNPRARGPAGAQGLMQVMPKTARGIARRIDRKARPYDPDFNVDAGTWLLHRLLGKADGNVRHALIGYNRGWGYVRRHIDDGEPFSPNVEAYVDRTLAARDAFARSRFAAELPPPAPAESAAAAQSGDP